MAPGWRKFSISEHGKVLSAKVMYDRFKTTTHLLIK